MRNRRTIRGGARGSLGLPPEIADLLTPNKARELSPEQAAMSAARRIKEAVKKRREEETKSTPYA